MTPAPAPVEFSRPVGLDSIGQGYTLEIEASEAERVALARRFDLRTLDRLHAEATLKPSAMGIEVTGRIDARVVQPCVVTNADVPGVIDEPFTLRFVSPAFLLASDAEEHELGTGDLDVVAHDASSIDLGEAVAQTLGLALDPFPRAGDADTVEEERRWSFGPEASPFAGLKGLLG